VNLKQRFVIYNIYHGNILNTQQLKKQIDTLNTGGIHMRTKAKTPPFCGGGSLLFLKTFNLNYRLFGSCAVSSFLAVA